MFEHLRAVLAHFGDVVLAEASQMAHVPEEAWDKLVALFETPANDEEAAVKTAITSAEQSVRTPIGNVVVQLQAGDLHKLTELAATECAARGPATATSGAAPSESPDHSEEVGSPDAALPTSGETPLAPLV